MMAGTALPAVLVWAALVLALAPTALRGRRAALVALVAGGVPVLGLVTHEYGPLWGLVALGLGMGALKAFHHGHRDPAGHFRLTRPNRPS